jgi:allophanate hydrolase
MKMDVASVSAAYDAGDLDPSSLYAMIRERAASYSDHNIWIHLLSAEEQAPFLERLGQLDPAEAPLWGIPFAIKDNIDLEGIPTTAGCPAFAYTPTESATVVRRFLEAGAIPVGKTNLDQFATGLNGTRSPYGVCHNSIDRRYISGGSSSGSAVAVALEMASFSLGTDTAGSGRVPAAFNGLVGVKPTRGIVSCAGVVPACRSLDCVSIFARNTGEANLLLSVAEGEDDGDPFSRCNPFANGYRNYGDVSGKLRVGILREDQLEFFDDEAFARSYEETLAELRACGEVEFVAVDFTPFREAAQLLYEGPWVAERTLACEQLLAHDRAAIEPTVLQILSGADGATAVELFRAQYRLNDLQQQCARAFETIDCLLTPTAPRLYTVEEMQAEPLLRNSELGFYTNFVNLLDLSALALPTLTTSEGMPFGVTLVAPGFRDRFLLSIGRRLERLFTPPGAEAQRAEQPLLPPQGALVDVAVCGAHLSGLPLNWQLQERGARLVETTTTARCYKLFALPDGPPMRPGMIRVDRGGHAIDVEIWRMPMEEFGGFVAQIPPPLGIGKVLLADGKLVCGFLCEAVDAGAEDISALGGWRSYLQCQR